MKQELFFTVIELLENYRKDISLTYQQAPILEEVIARIKNISDEYKDISELNTLLLDKNPGLQKIRNLMDDNNINKLLVDAARTDLKLAEYLKSVGGRVAMVQSSEIAAYDMGKLESRPGLKNIQIQLLHSKTESIYHNLWIVIQHLSQLPIFEKFKPVKVRDVRNRLIEHTANPKTSGASIFSFGVSTNGPVLRPTKPAGVPAPVDGGLDVNVEEFLLCIVKILS